MNATAALAALLIALSGMPPAPPPPPDVELELHVLAELHRLRLAHHGRAGRVDPRLAVAARRHSEDMARRRYFAHRSPEGLRVGDRAAEAGYAYRAVAETLYWTTPGTRETRAIAARAVEAWLESPAHRAVLLDPSLPDLGVGVSLADGRVLVTLVAGRRAVDA